MPFIDQFGQQAASMALGTIFGIGLEGHNDRRQLEQQRKLQQLQLSGQKDLTDYNLQKQLELWRATNYKPTVEELKKAGLNPALLYGMSGGGGGTTNLAQGTIQGSQAPQGGGEIMGLANMSLQNSLLEAQRKNIEADTENKKATTPKIQTETAALAQGIENAKAQERLTNVQTEIAQVEASVSRQTIMEQMKAWENMAAKGTEEITALRLQNDLSRSQFHDKIKDLKSQIAERSIKMALMNAQKQNTNQDTKNKIQEILESEARIKTMATQLMQGWDNLTLRGREFNLKDDEYLLKDNGWDFLPQGVIPNMLIPIGKGFGKQHTPIQGFR